MAAASGLRVGDAEREATAASLREHYAHGRLTLEEFQRRLDATFAAKTEVDLARITRDLPFAGGGSQPPPRARWQSSVRGASIQDGIWALAASSAALRGRPSVTGRRSWALASLWMLKRGAILRVIAGLAMGVLVLFVAGLLIGLALAGLWFVVKQVLIILAIVLVVRMLLRRYARSGTRRGTRR
ncbi:MAG TPA: DUF1707 domain-containing protein [Streptosporangiaceae bacterium]